MPACLFLRRLLLSSVKPIYPHSCVSPRVQFIFPGYRIQAGLTQASRFGHSWSSAPSSPVKEPKEASAFWTITFTLIVVCGGTWLQDKYFNTAKVVNASSQPQITEQWQEPFLGVIDTLKTMPAEFPPGTVGNLTAEQEVKLQEFWTIALRVFGIKPEGIDNSETSTPPSPSREKKKQPKRRFGFFGRKDEDEDEDANTENGISSSLASIDIADGDDKYGQSKEFQQALADIPAEELRTTFWNMVKQDDPDTLLLRFLRARKWDVKKALVMLISTIRWRIQDIKVDEDVVRTGEAHAVKQSESSDSEEKRKGEEFMLQIRQGKSFLHGVDKFGRPMCVVRVRLHRAADQSADTLERFTVYTIESARMMLAPPVETATIIFDMTNFTLANMDYAPVKFMIKCFEANYPESLGAVLIHKAPWIFSGIWNIIKGWLDPVVAAKIHFTKNVEDLEQFIPRDRIIKELGGDENWEYKYVEPQPDENKPMEDTATRDMLIAKRQDLARELQDATLSWIAASTKNDKGAATAAQEKRKELIGQLREQYWQLDPYVRARTYYDRIGVLKPGGKIEFYPESEKKEQTNGHSEKTT